MKIFINPDITLDRLREVARHIGAELYDSDDEGIRKSNKFAGKRAIKVLLRPVTDEFRMARPDSYTKSGVRRIWAVSWAGHYVFMRAVFELDPAAVIKTGLNSGSTYEYMPTAYEGLDDFLSKAWYTGSKNVGSMVEPASYRKCQSPGHREWDTEDDLLNMALEAINEKEIQHA